VSGPLLAVRGLTLAVEEGGRSVPLVRDLSFEVEAGEKLGVVGESGSGKSLSMLSIMRLLPTPPVRVVGGEVWWGGRDLLRLGERELREVRGREITMVYQDPLHSLNPVMRVGDQIAEALTAHEVRGAEARRRVLEVLHEVGMPDPERSVHAYPHEFSGGMRQRVMIAMALALSPRLLIADEPTTALDVTTQQQILDLVGRLHARTGMAVIWVTHDLGVVARLVDRLLVMYAGGLVERGTTAAVFEAPHHPYTSDLLGSLPRPTGDQRTALRQIPGAPPQPAELPAGCPYHPRCRQAVARCRQERPPLLPRGSGAAACWVPREQWT
jgi:oligopeptide/dipeptide ABC transporter ATP-binding protein